MKRLYEFIERKNHRHLLDEGVWSTPSTHAQVDALHKVLKKPLTAKDATDKIYNIIGDDTLFDNIDDIHREDPNVDVRTSVQRHIAKNMKHYTMPDDVRSKLHKIVHTQYK